MKHDWVNDTAHHRKASSSMQWRTMRFSWLTLILCSLTISAFAPLRVVRPAPKRIRQSSCLNGIKGFQAWFNTQFPDATIEIDNNSNENFDHVLVDMNQVLHVILRRSRSREHAIRLLMSELDRMIQITTPTQSLVLALDGPPAAAKLATQRRRRYGTLVRTQWKLEYFDKLRISKRSRDKRLRGYQSDLRSLELTPGTELMKSMEAALIYWAWQRLQHRYTKLQKVKIYINPSALPGEGEVKLLEWIFEHGRFSSHKNKKRKQSFCFLGGDSDLLLEGLVIPPSFAHNIFVVRQEFPRKHLCISLWEATRTMAKTLNPSNKNQIVQIRTDLVLLMIMNGNDYLPKLRGTRGFTHIVSVYMKTLKQHKSGLVHPDTLDFHLDFCISFFGIFVQQSPADLLANRVDQLTNQTRDDSERLSDESQKSERRTPLGELNNIIDGGFLPQQLKFRVVRGISDTDEDAVDGIDEVDEVDDDEDDVDDDELEDGGDVEDEDDSNKILVRMSLGKPDSDDYLLYEVWHDRGVSLRYARQKLAAMALDDFLGTDYAGGTDDFDFDTGITNRGYSWEINQAAEGKVDQYLAGLLWNLQTYQDGICADYGYNYGRRMSPTAMEVVNFFQEAKAQNRRVGKQQLLGGNDVSFQKPVSAGLACLAALPSEVKHLVPEPYRWLEDDTVENFYEQCVDPIDNVFDMKQFELLCNDEIEKISLQRNETCDEDTDCSHGSRVMTGDHHWTVLGKTKDPLRHPFDPPRPPSKEFSALYDNDFIRVSRVLATSRPRSRSVWGDKMPVESSKRNKITGPAELVHSDVGMLLAGTKSILDVDYKIAFPREHKRHMAQQRKRKRSNLLFDATPVVVANDAQKKPPQLLRVPDGVDVASRRKKFNLSQAPTSIAKNLDGQTALDILKGLGDIRMIGTAQFAMKTPSATDFASFDPEIFEQTTLKIPKSDSRSNLLKRTITKCQDRYLNQESRKLLKHHLASLALDEIAGAAYNWRKSSYSELKKHLMIAAGVRQVGKISLSVRLEDFNLLLPPEDPIENKDGLTAVNCLNQLRDAGMIGKTRFVNTSPSKSEFASLNPLNYEHVQLTIKRGKDKNISILRKDLCYGQDRDVKTQTRKALRQHLASLALSDITGPENRWSDLTFAELRKFLKQKSSARKLPSPPSD